MSVITYVSEIIKEKGLVLRGVWYKVNSNYIASLMLIRSSNNPLFLDEHNEHQFISRKEVSDQ